MDLTQSTHACYNGNRTRRYARPFILKKEVITMSWIHERKEKIEQLAKEYLEARGYEVERHIEYHSREIDGYEYTYPAESQPYEFIVRRDKKVARVSVKIAQHARKNQKDNYKIVTYTAKNPPSVYLVWLPHQERFVELPGTFFSNCNGTVRTVPIEIVKAWESKPKY